VRIKTLTSAVLTALCTATVALLALAAAAQAGLPDNRVYEMVSPVEKGGASDMPNLALASANGEHVIVDGGVANAQLSSGASWMLETRTPSGWSGVQIGPSPGQGSAEENFIEQRSTALAGVSEDFSQFAFQTLVGIDPRDQNSLPGVKGLAYGLYPVEDEPSSDVYVRDGPTGPFGWASGPPAPMVKTTAIPSKCNAEPIYCGENNAVIGGASADLGVVVWSQLAPLLVPPAAPPGSPADTHEYGSEVYESNGTDQRLVGLVPASGSECGVSGGGCVVPACGAAMSNAPGKVEVLSNSFAPTEGDVSGEGSQIVFTSPEPAVEGRNGCPPGEIYLRENGASTVNVSASHKTGGDPNGPQRKLYAGTARENGVIDTVFFTSKEELTNNANTGSSDGGNDLYAYNVASKELTDITPDENPVDANGASIVSFIGTSADGSIVYFTAEGVLTSVPNAYGEAAQPRAVNLYVYDNGTRTTRFIAPGAGVEGPRSAQAASQAHYRLTSEVTPDGKHLVFLSSEHIAPYDNVGSACSVNNENGEPEPHGCAEVYLYGSSSNALVCVSCDPSGFRPADSSSLAKELTAAVSLDLDEDPMTLVRPLVVSEDGQRVFFTSPDQLTPEAPPPSPGQFEGGGGIAQEGGSFEENVYEYESGHIYLIARDAALAAATPSGNDVFFYTDAQLVPQDRDGTIDIYDARVDGGFPALAAPECSGTSCQGLPAPAPIFVAPPSTTFSGVGNFTAPASSAAPQETKAAGKTRTAKKRKTARRRAKAAKGRHSPGKLGRTVRRRARKLGQRSEKGKKS
jgi:hypothetical protein